MQELEEDKQQARLATAIIPFGEQRGTLINEKKSSVSSVQDVPEPPRQPLQFFAAFGSRRRIPAADVQKPCKYFDPVLPAQRASTWCCPRALHRGDHTGLGKSSGEAKGFTVCAHPVPKVRRDFSLPSWHSSLLSVPGEGVWVTSTSAEAAQ